MKEYLSLLSASSLFSRIPPQDLPHLLSCLKVQVIRYQKENVIFQQDDPVRCFGMVLSGSVHVLRNNMQGSHIIVSAFGPGELFGEAFACAGVETYPVNVVASSDSIILLFEYKRVVSACSHGCMSHSILVTSLMQMIAKKNILLNQKLEVVMQRTTREKLLVFLKQHSLLAHSDRFSIPFDRQGLADYLGVERSAMSTELNKLKKDGLIDFDKSDFKLNN